MKTQLNQTFCSLTKDDFDDIEKKVKKQNMLYLIKNHQIWDKHNSFNYTYINENYETICSFKLEFEDTEYLFQSYFLLSAFYVQPEYIGNGYGKMMMDEVIELTKNVEYITLKVRQDNIIAINLYTKYGFEFDICDEDPNYIWMIKIK